MLITILTLSILILSGCEDSIVSSIPDWVQIREDHEANYGIRGTFDDSNYPPPRILGTPFYSSLYPTSLYMFGGSKVALTSDDYSDLWEFSLKTNQWRWVKGPDLPNQEEVCIEDGNWDEKNVPLGRIAGYGGDLRSTFLLFGGFNLRNWMGYHDVWEFSPITWYWRRLRKSSMTNAVYGDKGEYAEDNHPYRGFGTTKLFAMDSGKTELITILGAVSSEFYVHQIWKYSTTLNQWAYLAGSLQKNDFIGNYNIDKSSDCSAGHYPSSRAAGAVWMDSKKKHLYQFGGMYYRGEFTQETPMIYFHNDLWDYNLDTENWCWIGGDMGINSNENIIEEKKYNSLNIPAKMSPTIAWNYNISGIEYYMLFSGIGTMDISNFGSNEVWALRSTDFQWKLTSGVPNNKESHSKLLPEKLLGGIGWEINNMLYVFGGGNITSDEEEIDLRNSLWVFTKTEFTCHGYDLDDDDVCSGHGNCTALDSCVCDSGWNLDDCSDHDDDVDDDDDSTPNNITLALIMSIVVPSTLVVVVISAFAISVGVVSLYMYSRRSVSKKRIIERFDNINEKKNDYGTIEIEKN